MAAGRATPAPDWAALSRLPLPALRPAGRAELVADEDYEARAFDALAGEALRADWVRFLDCRIGELELGSARVTAARFAGCTIDRLVLTGAVLAAVDLQGAELSAVDGIARMAGTLEPAATTPAGARSRRPAGYHRLGCPGQRAVTAEQ